MSNTSDQTTKPSKKTRLIIGEVGVDTETGIVGKGHSYDNGKTFTVDDTIYGRIYHANDHGKIWQGIQDKVAKVVTPAKSAADSAVAYANDAVEKSRVNSQAIDDINSAVSDAVSDAAVARSDGLRAWDAAQSNVGLIDSNYASASAAISSARTEAIAAADEAKASASAAQAGIVAVRSDVAVAKSDIADTKTNLTIQAKSLSSYAAQASAEYASTASALSDAKMELSSDVAETKKLANNAQTTADSAVKSAGENAKALTSQANALSDARKAMDSGIANAKELANAAQATAGSAVESASSVANNLAAVASQANANANGITKVTSDVGLLQTTVADNSGNISKIQETAKQIQQAVSDNSGAIVVATQTAQGAVTVASDAKSNATVAVQTASEASVTAKNAQGDAATAMVTSKGAVTQASDAKSNATIAIQTASEASLTATNAQGDASIAKQTASETSTQIKTAQGDISKLQTRAEKIEASVANNSGAIANVQATANQLKASVSDNAGNITVAKQTADSAVTVASDARSNATVAIQTASQASITANNASGQAASAVLTASGAMTTASNAKSDATVAIQTASGASLTATDAKDDATIAKQTASEATVQASNAESDFAQLSIRANKIEANVANNSGAIASVQQTANGLTTTVADIKANGGGVNLAHNTSNAYVIPGDPVGYKNIGSLSTDEWVALAGETITIGVTIEWTNWQVSDKNRIGFELAPAKNGKGYWNNAFGLWCHPVNGSSGEQRLTATRTINNDIDGVDEGFAYVQGKCDTAKISELMIERGSVAHDWSPSPDDLQNQFTQIKESIDGVTTTINDPKTGLNATYQTAAGNATTISNAQGDIAKLKTRADGFDTEFSTANGNISKLQADASGTKQTLTNAKSDIAVLQSRADGLDAKYADAAGDINTLKANASGFSQTLVSAKGDISTLQSTATGLKNTLTDAQGNISTLQSDVSGLKKTTSDNTGNIATLQADAKTLASQMSSAQGDISTLQQTASGISSQVSGMSGDLNNLKSQAQWVIVTDTVDLNNIKTPCHEFLKGGVTNAPNEVAWWDLTVEGSESERITQTVIADQSNNRYTRRFADSWSAWVKVANQNDIDTLNGKITANTTAINQNKNAIALKADQTTVDKINGTVSQMQSTLTVQAGQIQEKVTSSQVTGMLAGYATQDYTQSLVTQKADDWNLNLTKLKNGTKTSLTNLSATVDGIQSQVYNSDGSSKITQLSNVIQTKVGTDDFNNLKQSVGLQTLDSADINNMKTNGHYFVHNLANNPIGSWVYVDVTGNGIDRIRQDVYQDSGTKHKYRRWFGTYWTDWEEGATYTEINQLQDAINLRVTKGDLISQINLEAGTALIQSNKIVLDAGTTVFTGDAFIPAAAIAELDADKLTFYGNGSKATIGASVAQYDDDKQKSTINLQYNGGIEIHSSNQQGSILTMHDNTIRLASKSWGDNSNPYQYSGFYAAPNYSLMNTYHRDGTTSGVAIDDDRIHIYGSSKDNQLGALQADVGWYSINGKTGLLTGNQISLKAGNTQAVLNDNNININNASDTNDKNYDVAIHIKGWAEMTGWFTCMGLTQTSLLSTKTRIEPLDTAKALELINSADVATYQYKQEVAHGGTKRHASVIIDDVNDVAQYQTPDEIISEDRKGRNDGDIVGYLMGAVQELTKRLKTLESKVG